MYNAGIQPELRTAADTSATPGGVAVSARAPGQTATVSVQLENFSARPLTHVTASLSVPAGLTASSPAAHGVPPGSTATIPVTVTAPATITAPLSAASVTVTASYRNVDHSWSLSRTAELVAAPLTPLP